MYRTTVKSLKLIGAVVGVVAASGGGWAGYLRLSGNFHVVDQGAVYRSGQLSGSQFSARIRENGIRTIIDLRGNNAGSPWYDDEVRASDAAGVRHVDFPISASRQLTDQQISRLAGLLTSSPRPILIHCEGGADRTGLASALYKLVVDESPPSEAAAQLSFRYGHFPWFWSGTAAMDLTFARAVSHTATAK
jgi:protein tyrosine/serine phosphatase